MDFRIADTFTDSLAHLTGDEQKAAKTTAFDLQMNPSNPGMSFHKLDKARDKNFWSVRVNRDVRLIVHRTSGSLLLCYVGHHDDAYHWAECRKIETHPNTGAAQIVEIRERIEEIRIPKYVEVLAETVPAKPLFADIADKVLLRFGVPAEWLDDVRRVDSEDGLLALTDHLPTEAAEALVELATGGDPTLRIIERSLATRSAQYLGFGTPDTGGDGIQAHVPGPDESGANAMPVTNPFDHPDAQRRFRTIRDADELARALDAPWDKWTIFLHPDQREWVERNFNGPARVSGSAGTGKTIVALHRAVHLARTNPESRVLLSTFSKPLANALKVKLRRLVGTQPHLAERIDVYAMDEIGERLYEQAIGKPRFASEMEIAELLAGVATEHPGHGFSDGFLLTEWWQVVDAWQLDTWEGYRDVQRLGRRTRLSESRRLALWKIYSAALAKLKSSGRMTRANMFDQIAGNLATRERAPFDFVVVDEAQDISVAQLRFLAALAGTRQNGLFLAGDLGQRIFQQPFSWKSQGVEVRGRSRTLHVNYRTSHQIRARADRLLDPEIADVDGNIESRAGTVSAFNGPEPKLVTFDDAAAELSAVGAWLAERMKEGIPASEIAIFVRSADELQRAQDAVTASGMQGQVLDERVRIEPGKVVISTMHLAKGLEFRIVVVMACDDEVIPSQERISQVADDAELEEVYNTERHLLYVACTRARDRLWLSGIEPVSEFFADMLPSLDPSDL